MSATRMSSKELENKYIIAKATNDSLCKVLATLVTIKMQKQISIEEIGLSTRAKECLKHNNVFTLYDILSHSAEEISRFKNIGIRTANEVITTATLYGALSPSRA